MKKLNSNKTMNIPIEKIDKVIHEPARMKIMANLYFVENTWMQFFYYDKQILLGEI
jgi:hypothetical protein